MFINPTAHPLYDYVVFRNKPYKLSAIKLTKHLMLVFIAIFMVFICNSIVFRYGIISCSAESIAPQIKTNKPSALSELDNSPFFDPRDPDDIRPFVTLTSSQLASLTKSINGSLKFLGYLKKGNADNLYTNGFFYLNPDGRFLNLPNGTQEYGVLLNMSSKNGQTVQVYIDSHNNEIYLRHRSRIGTFSPWIKMHNPYDSITKIYLIGDSLTRGRYSYYDENNNPVTSIDKKNGWATKLFKEIRKYGTVVNYSYSGMGWIRKTTEKKLSPYQIISEKSFSDASYIVIWLGINDYNMSDPLGSPGTSTSHDGTVCGEIIRCLDLLTTKTHAPICLITPLNCRMQGSLETHYSLDYKNSRGYTLRDLCKAIIYYADFYGINAVNLSEHCSINQTNMEYYLPDKVHPTLDGYTLLARELDQKLGFR